MTDLLAYLTDRSDVELYLLDDPPVVGETHGDSAGLLHDLLTSNGYTANEADTICGFVVLALRTPR